MLIEKIFTPQTVYIPRLSIEKYQYNIMKCTWFRILITVTLNVYCRLFYYWVYNLFVYYRTRYRLWGFFFVFMFVEASGCAGAQSVTVKTTGCGFDPHPTLFLFIFSFLRSGVEAKRGVEIRHLIRNASRIRRKVGNRVSPH